VGPNFFDGIVTEESNLEMLLEVVLPELEKSPLYDNTEIIWQKDGAPSYYSLRVREFLNNSFPEWMDGMVQMTGTRDHEISCHVIFQCGA
jgi:hypothetical protein